MSTGVSLRGVTDADLPTFYHQQADPEATRMAVFPARDRAAFDGHWAKIRADETNVIRTVVVDGAVAGNVLCFGPPHAREVGYWLGRPFWGRGVASSALALFLDEVTERPLYAHVARHNAGSARVLEKCGFRLVAEHPTPPEDPAGVELVFALYGTSSSERPSGR
jgi:RimJ/RimL family protein N-acetyltransferase